MRGRKARRWLFGLVAVIAAMALTYVYTGRRIESEIRKEREALVALGVPMTASEVSELTSTEGSGIHELQRAAEEVRLVPDHLITSTREAASNSAKDSKADMDLIQAAKPMFPHAARASEYDNLMGPFNWEVDDGMPDWRQDRRDVLRFLARLTGSMARTGDLQGAVDVLRLADELAQKSSYFPTTIDVLVWSAEQAAVSGLWRYLASFSANDAEALRLLSGALGSEIALPPARWFHLADPYEGELYLLNDSYDGWRLADIFRGDLPPDTESAFLSTSRGRKLVQLELLRAWRMAFEQMPEDGQSEEAVNRALLVGEAYLGGGGIAKSATRLYWSDVEYIEGKLTAQLAKRRAASAGIQLLLHRLETGSFPAAMPDYGVASTDPFTGKPLLFKIDSRYLLVYGTGPDKKDDGGNTLRDAVQAFDLQLARPSRAVAR